jgi:hypothetical protein
LVKVEVLPGNRCRICWRSVLLFFVHS